MMTWGESINKQGVSTSIDPLAPVGAIIFAGVIIGVGTNAGRDAVKDESDRLNFNFHKGPKSPGNHLTRCYEGADNHANYISRSGDQQCVADSQDGSRVDHHAVIALQGIGQKVSEYLARQKLGGIGGETTCCQYTESLDASGIQRILQRYCSQKNL